MAAHTSTYEVIITSTTDTVYRVIASSEGAAIEAADDKLMAGERPLYENRHDNGHRVRLIPPPQPVSVVGQTSPTRRSRKSEYLTMDEAMAELHLSRSTVTRWIHAGIIKAHKLGGDERGRHWRIPRSEIERLLRGD